MNTALRDQLAEIYQGRANRRYGLADVSQLQHALQAAALAERAGEAPALVLAALLHDVGHMIHDLGENPAAEGVDDRHEELGAQWLARHFTPAVVEPVRLHVPAKRYLCATEPGYFDALSEDSVLSLALQGGPMSATEVASFEARPWSREAVRLRRYDEAAKDAQALTEPVTHFLRHIGVCLRG